ncbi:MAG: hypothetical protein JWO57_953 [Pseudonocardiales bacterium]|nr:hypothetical protein [Pseudonocardiales bacterium]
MSRPSISGDAGAETDAPPAPATRPPRLVTLLVRPLVAGLAVVVVVLAGTGAVNATTEGAQALDRSRFTPDTQRKLQFETVQRELVAKVPRGARVCLPPEFLNDEWEQRIAEFGAMNGIVLLTDPRQADYMLSFAVNVNDKRVTGGLHLVVTPTGR